VSSKKGQIGAHNLRLENIQGKKIHYEQEPTKLDPSKIQMIDLLAIYYKISMFKVTKNKKIKVIWPCMKYFQVDSKS
jgi:hypothetical protein